MERIAAAIVAKLRAVFVLQSSKNTHRAVLNDTSSFAPSRFVRLWIPNERLSQCRSTLPQSSLGVLRDDDNGQQLLERFNITPPPLSSINATS